MVRPWADGPFQLIIPPKGELLKKVSLCSLRFCPHQSTKFGATVLARHRRCSNNDVSYPQHHDPRLKFDLPPGAQYHISQGQSRFYHLLPGFHRRATWASPPRRDLLISENRGIYRDTRSHAGKCGPASRFRSGRRGVQEIRL